MQDRIGIGEVLAGAGAIGLTLLLIFGKWFSLTTTLRFPVDAAREATFGAGELGWFAFALAAVAALSGLLFLFRVLTAPTTERIMLQGPVAYVLSLLALIVVAARILLFMPDLEGSVSFGSVELMTVETGLTTAAWLGLLSLLLLVIGTWLSISDTRSDTPAARAQTAALLARTPIRPAPPHADVRPGSDAGVVGDDAIGTDPATPPTGEQPA